MKSAAYTLLLVALLFGSFLAGSWYTRRDSGADHPSADRKVLYYVDPMHPAYRSDKPGVAPDCGMELVPVYDGGTLERAGGAIDMSAGTINVSPGKQRLIGVRLATVEKAPGTHTLRVLGRVVPDETRIYRINAATDGWIKTILPVTTDSLVQKDELLATFYAPEFSSAVKAYLYGLRSLDRFEASRKETKEQLELTGGNIENYRTALRNLGMTEHQLDEIQRTREGGSHVEIRAPAGGFIMARNITLGQRFERGSELFRIADLARVWIVAETYGSEAAALKPGMAVRVSAPQLQRTYSARVAPVPPSFDPTTRALKVRLEADNFGLLLRPEMFVDVELPVSLSPAITIPVDALVDSGVRQTVFVDKGDGIFEPRRVETGWRAGNQVEIVKGLMVGERIVVSGTFLIDSESRMQAAAAGLTREMSQDPVCGMDVDQAKANAAGRTAAYKGQAYYFCSDECKVSFDKEPARYAAREAGSRQEAAGSERGKGQSAQRTGQSVKGEGRGEAGSEQPSSDGKMLEASHAGHMHP